MIFENENQYSRITNTFQERWFWAFQIINIWNLSSFPFFLKYVQKSKKIEKFDFFSKGVLLNLHFDQKIGENL